MDRGRWGLLSVAAAAAAFAHFLAPALASRLRVGEEPDVAFTPPAFLIMSSPTERKVSYTFLPNIQAVGGAIEPLIDAGLGGPRGLAYDAARSALYVADPPERRIIRYRLRVRRCAAAGAGQQPPQGACKLDYELAVEGVQLTVARDVLASWVAVDADGSLYFTDQESKSISRIEASIIKRLLEGEIQAGDLGLTTEREAEARAAADASRELAAEAAAPAPAPNLQAVAGLLRSAIVPAGEGPQATSIVALYQAAASPHVGVPGGVATDGVDVYWANQEDGLRAGSVVTGSAAPSAPAQPSSGGQAASFTTEALARNTDTAYGVVGTDNLVLFTDHARSLHGVSKQGGAVTTLSDAFDAPRGIAWDGDSTAFVADQGSDAIYSLPCGRLESGRPLRRVVDIHGPFGVALLKGTDPALSAVLAGSSGAAATGTATALLRSLAAWWSGSGSAR